ncbi:hypothetical protein Fmac_021499 [Flemingia macrophylla]|uniref:Uncharacterized protein n=1 Tax=Flemingia macrophylla TaxID=520843 RepID=A0ABD1LX30_9FABA
MTTIYTYKYASAHWPFESGDVVACTDSHRDWVGLQCTACVAYAKRTSKGLSCAKAAFAHSFVFLLGEACVSSLPRLESPSLLLPPQAALVLSPHPSSSDLPATNTKTRHNSWRCGRSVGEGVGEQNVWEATNEQQEEKLSIVPYIRYDSYFFQNVDAT